MRFRLASARFSARGGSPHAAVAKAPPPRHTHDWSTDYKYDDTHHWFPCTGCKEKDAYARHDFDEYGKCFCGAYNPDINKDPGKPHDHNWSQDWSYDSAYHWHECTYPDCYESDNREPHDFDERGKCFCGAADAQQGKDPIGQQHGWAQAWSSDETQHWHACTVSGCPDITDLSDHEYGAGNKCVCGASKVSVGLQYSTVSGGYAVDGNGSCQDTEIIIPAVYNGLPVIAINNRAFYRHDILESVIIPDSVTSIGNEAFSACGALSSVTVGANVSNIGSGAFKDCVSLSEIDIPGGVTAIGDSAFHNCSSLSSIEIPGGVTAIGNNTFQGCDELSSVTIGANVTAIGDSAFYRCGSLSSIVIPDGVTFIGDNAFSSCSSLSSINIPDSVTSIGSSTFENCDTLQFTAYDNGRYLGNAGNPYRALVKSADWSISSCTIHADTKIIAGAFRFCYNLSSIVIPDGVTTIGSGAFQSCSELSSISIPDSVTAIGERAFSGCGSLSSIIIPDGVTAIGDSAFYRCGSLSSIVIPDGVMSIGERAFDSCSNLSNVTFRNNIERMNANVFRACNALTEITLGDNATGASTNVFAECNSLESINVSQGNADYASRDGVLYNKALTAIVYVPKAIKGSVTVPVGVTDIGRAFTDRASLSGISIPDGVTSIGNGAFIGCVALSSVSLPDSVTSIGSSAFGDCNSISNITIPDGVISIGDGAFARCCSLSSISIPDSVTSVYRSTFNDCTNLQFTEYDRLLYLGNASNPYAALIKTNYDYINECEIHSGTKAVAIGALNNLYSLKSITAPESNTNYASSGDILYNKAFTQIIHVPYNIEGAVTLPAGVTTIDGSVFNSRNRLASISIPASVTSINNGAFDGCGRLESITVSEANAKYKSVDGVLYNKQLTEIIKVPTNIRDSITIPDSVDIDFEKFDYCPELKSVTVSQSNAKYATIGGVLYNKELTRILYVPPAIEGSITVPDTVGYLDNSLFRVCYSLESIIVSQSNPYYANIDGVIYTKDLLAIICVPYAITGAITIPDSVISIDGLMFSELPALESIIVSQSNPNYASIDGILYDKELTRIICLPYAVTGTVAIPDGITIIDGYIFSNRTGITSIIVPAGITDIYNAFMFNNCPSLSEFYYKGTEESWAAVNAHTELTAAPIYYYSATRPTQSGNYWHYAADGVTAVKW